MKIYANKADNLSQESVDATIGHLMSLKMDLEELTRYSDCPKVLDFFSRESADMQDAVNQIRFLADDIGYFLDECKAMAEMNGY